VQALALNNARTATIVSFLVMLLTACASPPTVGTSGSSSQRSSVEAARSTQPVRVTAVIRGDPPTLNHNVNRATSLFSIPGGVEVQMLVSAGLGVVDDRGVVHAQLAEAVPSIENGLWKLHPDGKMETTWKIRENAQWHDGRPFRSDDLVFTAMLVRDKDLAVFRNVAFDAIGSVEAPDPLTVVVKWDRPFIDADTLFTPDLALPMPRHLLEEDYLQSKDTFFAQRYWAEDFVGTGPFRLREFVRSSRVSLSAFDRFPLGRPKIDEIEVLFIPDSNTLMANILSGAAELSLGRNISIEEALTLRDQWTTGDVKVTQDLWLSIFPQYISPTPAVIGDPNFRRALLRALDRRQMVDAFQGGLTGVADAFLSPDQPAYKDIESAIVRHEYDPRAAEQGLTELGYTKGSDGSLRDRSGQPLSVETRVTAATEVSRKAMFAVADSWQRLGVDVQTVVIPTQRTSDREYMATFPSFMFYRQSSQIQFLQIRHSSQAPLPQTNFVGQNYERYIDPAFDALIDRFYVTIPRDERMGILRQVVHNMTDEVHLLGLFYDGTPALMRKRLQNITPQQQGWNAYLWEAR